MRTGRWELLCAPIHFNMISKYSQSPQSCVYTHLGTRKCSQLAFLTGNLSNFHEHLNVQVLRSTFKRKNYLTHEGLLKSVTHKGLKLGPCLYFLCLEKGMKFILKELFTTDISIQVTGSIMLSINIIA